MGYFLSLLFLLFATPAFATYCPNCGGTGGISSVTGTSPVNVSAGASPVVSLTFPNCANDGSHAYTGPTGAGSILCSTINAGSGTATSVGFATNIPGVTVSSSPVTTAGTLTATLATQSAHFTLIGPTSGSAALPTWRALVAADLPLPTSSTIGGVQSKLAVASTYLTGIDPTTGAISAAQVNYTDLQGTQPASIVPVTVAVSGPTTIVLPGVNKSSIQRLNLTASATITIPPASWVGQQVQLVLCQDATGGRTWNIAASGVTIRGVFAIGSTTPNLCQICGLSYASSISEAFLTNPGCTQEE